MKTRKHKMENNETETLKQEPQNKVKLPPKKKKTKKNKNNKGLVVFIIILIVAVGFGIFKDTLFNKLSTNVSFKNENKYIAELYIEGTIQPENESYNQTWLLETIDELQKDTNNVGTILFINSPGGSVYESDEVYLALKKYNETKTLWAYLGSVAASGGYYIACSAENIIANRNTLTGSIGVIAGQSVDLSEFMTKHGIKMTTFTAGKNKNMLNIDQPVTPEQKEIMQSVADECYEQFTQIVADGRKLPIETVKTLADGRIYTANQALNNKLVDDILSYEEAKSQMKEYFSEIENLNFTEYKYLKEKNFYNYLFDMYSKAKGTKSETDLLERIILEYSQMDYPAYLYIK